MRSRSTPVDPNECRMCSNVLSHHARRSKCGSYVLKCALARRPSVQMRFLYAELWSRSTPVDPNALPRCSNVLSLDACRFKICFLCVSKAMVYVLHIDSFGFLFCPGLDQAIFEPRHTFPKLWQIRSVLLCFDICFVQMFPWSGAAKLGACERISVMIS